MFNKIYDKVIKFIKEDYKFIIFVSIVLFLGLFRLPYNIYVSGGIINLEKRLIVEGEKDISGSYNLAYVKSLRATIPSYLLSYVLDWERSSIESSQIDSNDTPEDIWLREQLYLQQANDNAIISAYKEAGEDINIKNEILKILYVLEDSETDLKTGDIIKEVNNIPLKEFNEIKKILEEFNVGDKVSVKYIRNDIEYDGYFIVKDLDGEKKAGLYIIKLYDYDINKKVSLKFKNSEGGSSGGFITSLAIYTKLKGDITNHMKIVGTGTIDGDGNVGEIGGIKYKLKGAVKNKADIFFVPEGNYEEAMKIKDEKGYKINIVQVKTLREAIEYLESR